VSGKRGTVNRVANRQKPKESKQNSNQATFAAPLPNNVDAERSVLGAILLDPSAAMKAFSVLKGDEFFLDGHRVIFSALRVMIGEGIPADLVPLTDLIYRQKNLERVGGAGYLASLADGMPKVSNVEHYARIVKEKAALRNLIHTTHNIQQKAFEGHDKSEEILESALQSILAMVSVSDGPLVRKWYDVAQSALRKIQTEREFPENSTKVYFGLKDLDEATSGLREGELVVIVGPTSNGKTLLAQQLAVYSAEQGYAGTIFSAEMSGESVVSRELAFDAGLDFWKIRYPEKMSDLEFDALSSAAGKIRNLVIVEKDISPMNIWAICEMHKKTRNLKFVVVDYDQLVIESGIDPEDEEGFFRHQRRFVLETKRVAERLGLCFILLSQLRKVSSRIAQGGKPTIDDIYGDSSIRNTPDVIIWVVRHFFNHGLKKEFERKATAFVVKARNGRVARIDLTFDQHRVRMLDEEPSEKNSKVDNTKSEKLPFAIEEN
jgi:replicative DNA helicase